MPTHEMGTDPTNITSPSDDKPGPEPTLEGLFSQYTIQSSIMQNLNFYDFRNLRLTGCQVPATSWAVQKKHLHPIHCNQEVVADITCVPSECGKTPPNVVKMKACQGLSLRPDDAEIEFDQSRAGRLHDGCDQSQCFWGCYECISRLHEYYDDYGLFQTPYTRLCEMHSLEQEKFPYNACRCCNAAIGDWRCSTCVESSFQVLENRADQAYFAVPRLVTLFGFWTFIVRPQVDGAYWLIRWLLRSQNVLNRSMPWRFLSMFGIRHRKLQIVKRSRVCPVENCRRAAWDNRLAMQMCLQCKAVFPSDPGRFWDFW